MFLYKFISIKYVKQALGIYDVYGSEDLWNSESGSVVSDSLRPHGLYSPWNSPAQNTGLDSLSLLQGIFSTQGSNPGLPHCRQILYQLSHKGSPRILGCVAYPLSSRAFWLRNRTGVSCIARGFFNIWNSFKAIKEGERPLSSKLQVTFSGHQNFLTSD